MGLEIFSLIVAFIITLFASFTELTVTVDGKRRATVIGKILIGLTLLGFVLQCFVVGFNELDKKVLLGTIEKQTSIINGYTDQSNKRFTEPILTRQNETYFKSDSIKTGVDKLGVDVSKIPIKPIPDIKPEVFLSNIEIDSTDKNHHQFKTFFTSTQATAYNGVIEMYLMQRDFKGELYYLGKGDNLESSRFNLNVPLFQSFGIKNETSNRKLNKLYYLIKGKYEDSKGKKFVFDTLIYFQPNKQMISSLRGDDRKEVSDLFNKNGIR